MTLKITLAILFPLLVLFGAWIAGFDFNERGRAALLVYFLAVWSGAMGVFFANAVETMKRIG